MDRHDALQFHPMVQSGVLCTQQASTLFKQEMIQVKNSTIVQAIPEIPRQYDRAEELLVRRMREGLPCAPGCPAANYFFGPECWPSATGSE